jgi:hypothetical protein
VEILIKIHEKYQKNAQKDQRLSKLIAFTSYRRSLPTILHCFRRYGVATNGVLAISLLMVNRSVNRLLFAAINA